MCSLRSIERCSLTHNCTFISRFAEKKMCLKYLEHRPRKIIQAHTDTVRLCNIAQIFLATWKSNSLQHVKILDGMQTMTLQPTPPPPPPPPQCSLKFWKWINVLKNAVKILKPKNTWNNIQPNNKRKIQAETNTEERKTKSFRRNSASNVWK